MLVQDNAAKPAQKKGNRRKNASSANQSFDSKVHFRPYHSVSVPKSVDLHELLDERKPKTTAMLRNIPNRYTQTTLLQVVDAAGFSEAYDFFYLPMDTQNRTNVGYCFINFTNPAGLQKFISTFAGYSFNDHSSSKIARVSPAHIQGFIENIRHFANRAVAQSRNSQYRPIVIHQGIHMDITEAYELLCSVQGEKPSAKPAGLQMSSAKRPLPPGPMCSQPTLLVPGRVPANKADQKDEAVPSVRSDPPSTKKEPPQQHHEQTQQELAPSPAASDGWMHPLFFMPPMLHGPDNAEDLGGAFCEAKLGFEAAISQLLVQSTKAKEECRQRVSDLGGGQLFGSLVLPPGLTREEDEETVTAGVSRASSVQASPRCCGRELEGFDKQMLDRAEDSEPVTPRTNRTLFVHGRISV